MSSSTQKIHKIFIILGPTASGKSEYAVKIAKEHNGEIISADSRQVYKALNKGTGKVSGKWILTQTAKNPRRVFIYKHTPHYCIDFVSAKTQYSVASFVRDAKKAIVDITKRDRTPIICGGTGHYIDALIYDQTIPEVPPNQKLRATLSKKSAAVLFADLQKKDPARAANIDKNNVRRLVRALEIIAATKQPVPIKTKEKPSTKFTLPNGSTLKIIIKYLKPSRAVLYRRIEQRLRERVRKGMVAEAVDLHKNGLSWVRMDQLGLEYRFLARFLKRQKNRQRRLNALFLASPEYEMLLSEIKKYSKRQETWFRKYER